MEIISETDSEITIKFNELNKVNTPLLSALRRTIISEVNTIAIDTVDFYYNESPFPDEYLAHRLGLLVLNSMGLQSENEISFEFNLNTQESKSEIITVYSGMLTDPNNLIVNKNVPLFKIKKGQKIKFIAKTKLGNGLEHAKWSPVCPCYVNKDLLIVESTGSLTPKEIVYRGLKTLENKLKHFVILNETN